MSLRPLCVVITRRHDEETQIRHYEDEGRRNTNPSLRGGTTK